MRESLTAQRVLAREHLSRGHFDIVVIGGGIVGLSTAWLAARSGLRVALVERADYAAATSSASSKLAHGGLRYLAMGNFKLVHENHSERRALARYVAPHDVTPLPFLVALYEGGPHGRAAIGAGMLAYTALSGFNDGVGRLISPKKAREYVPALSEKNLLGCGFYHDHQMNDSRLALTVAKAAIGAGAVLINHTEVLSLRTTDGKASGVEARDRLDGTEFGIDAKVVVNAAGPWVDQIRQLEDPGARPSMRLSKGAHLVLRRHGTWDAAVTVPLEGGRVSFAVPWEGRLLVGTTDEPFEDDPAKVGVTERDVEQILGEAGQALSPEHLRREDIMYSYAGLRVLPGGEGDTQHAKRETVISVGSKGMLSIAGGKWTTFRHIGGQVLDRLRTLLPAFKVDDSKTPLPGAGAPDAVRQVVESGLPELPEDVVEHLVRHHGTVTHEILDLGLREPALLERVHPDGPDIWAQVVYAIENEWAYEVDDVLRRRTTVTVRGLDTPEIRERVATLIER